MTTKQFCKEMKCRFLNIHQWQFVGSYMGTGGGIQALDVCVFCRAERYGRFLRNVDEEKTDEEVARLAEIKQQKANL